MIVASPAQHLADRIRREGPITVAEYMNVVTEAYYARGDVFGAAGDFITAPEISQTFGELIGLWCAVVWQGMGAPQPFCLVECGPGRGTLMKDVLRAAGRVANFDAAADIHLIERSPALRAIQRETLKGRAVTWHADIGSVPDGPMILVANEFLDALPVHQYEKTASGWMERYVGVGEDGSFAFTLKPAAVDAAPAAAPGAIFESSPAVRAFIQGAASRIAKSGGAALLIDYGHTASACGETLQAVKKHRPCGIFETPGEADLTAHVDFAAVTAAARAGGVAVFGPIEQGTWLNRLGIKLRGLTLSNGQSPQIAGAVEAGIRRLIEPDAMGALFKVIALLHPALATPDGFQQDAGA